MSQQPHNDESEPREISIEDEASIPLGVRKRPSMYVGTTELFGLIHYLVCPVSLLLEQGAKRIAVSVNDAFEVSSDAVVELEPTAKGRLAPFEEICPRPQNAGHGYEGIVLNALSEELSVVITSTAQTEELEYTRGELSSHDVTEARNSPPGTILRFRPDGSIFAVTELSPTIFESYFRRLSYLHRGVRFSLNAAGQSRHFFAENGIADLFTAVSSPYQILHKPIHITAREGDLDLELVMAYQSWSDDHLWCFINHGRAVEGGTHEQGLRLALERLKKKLALPAHVTNGVVAVLAIRYPKTVWEGCLKTRISNPELKELVSRLVVDETIAWLRDRSDLAAQLPTLRVFQFPDTWYR